MRRYSEDKSVSPRIRFDIRDGYLRPLRNGLHISNLLARRKIFARLVFLFAQLRITNNCFARLHNKDFPDIASKVHGPSPPDRHQWTTITMTKYPRTLGVITHQN